MCNQHHLHHPTVSAIINKNPAFQSIEEQELERRWPLALNELKSLLKRLRDMGPANKEKLPEALSQAEKKQITRAIFQSLTHDDRPELKRSVARRMADKIGDYLLWRRETSFPVIHELVVLLPWWTSHIPGAVIPALRDIGLKYILNGVVLPVQTVWQDILAAPLVYLGHCACRSSGVVDDLYQPSGKVFNLLTKEQSAMLLDRFMKRCSSLADSSGQLPDTDPLYQRKYRHLAKLKEKKSSEYCLETLLELTYPHWEILPILDKYTPSWVRSLHRNHKAHLMHKELVFELATILYLARGTIFSSMKLFDTPYTICSCPTPEAGGGCTLTNWYYGGMSKTSLIPNEAAHGRKRDQNGEPAPCENFPLRSSRDCLGCGCRHDEEFPRDFERILSEADSIFQKR
jgi:hypothetical protein